MLLVAAEPVCQGAAGYAQEKGSGKETQCAGKKRAVRTGLNPPSREQAASRQREKGKGEGQGCGSDKSDNWTIHAMGSIIEETLFKAL
jgi:hypothetical protein